MIDRKFVKKFTAPKYLILVFLTLGVILLDQWTKGLVVDRFRLGESIPIISEFFNLTRVHNTGAAFGILAHANPVFRVPFFLIVPVVALGAIAYVFRKIPDKDVKMSTALSLVVGGAVGNLLDRLMYHHVIDFLEFHWRYRWHFPAFNVADAAICVGVGILMLDIITNDLAAAPKARRKRA